MKRLTRPVGSPTRRAGDQMQPLDGFLIRRNREIGSQLHESKNNINFPLKVYEKGELMGVDTMLNQIIVLYKNGIFDILPKGVVGSKANEWLGFKTNNISFWGILPSSASDHNPRKKTSISLHSMQSIDVYDYWHNLNTQTNE